MFKPEDDSPGAGLKFATFCCGMLLLMLLIAGRPMYAQVNLATLRGTVLDSSGAAVDNANVILTEPATGIKIRQVVTDNNGNYEVPDVKPGTYQLNVEKTGFESFVARDILLESGQIRRQDAKLKIGAVTESVQVTAGAAVISTESGTVEGTFSAKDNDKAPLVSIYPTPYSLLTTISGVQGGGGVYPVVNGLGQAQQTQSFDGIPNDTSGEQSDNSNFFEQVTAVTINAPADSARPVQINEVTKRGTDRFHGKASYKIYSSALDAAPYTPSSGVTPGVPIKPPYLQHEWDVEVGGPILRNRTFFFGQWFAQRIPLGTDIPLTVPPTPWRTGDFSSLLQASSPTQIVDPTTGQPFPNNVIPANRLSSVALAVQNTYYPTPAGSGLSGGTASYPNSVYHFPFNSDLFKGDWLDFRVDHNLTSKNSLFVRWLERRTPYVLWDSTPTPIWTRLRRHQQWAAGDTHVFSANLVNNFRVGIGFDYIKDGDPEGGQTPPDGTSIVKAIGLQGSDPSGLTGQGAPTINFNGASGIFGFGNVAGGVKDDNSTITLNDNVQWQTGRHVLQVGGNYTRYKIFEGAVPDYGTMNFDGSFSGFDYADFLLGIPTETLRTVPIVNQTQHSYELGFFAQDTFKLSPKLTLDYGLRWDYFGAPTADSGLMYNFDPTTGNLVVNPSVIGKVSPLFPRTTTAAAPPNTCSAPSCSITVPINIVAGQVTAIPDKVSFVPRIGVAYRFSDKFVLRGGYGIYTARLSSGYGDFNSSGFANSPSYGYFGVINPQLGQTGPFAVSQDYFNTITSGKPSFQFPNPYPASSASSVPPSVSAYGYPRDVTNGRIQQYNISLEREIDNNGVRVSYVGSRSQNMNYSLNVNKPHPSVNPFFPSLRPYPQFVNVNETRYDGSAHYDAFQVAAIRRASSFTFNASYTYAYSTANFLDTENPDDVLSHWANDGSTMRHYLSVATTWALPFGQGHRFLGNASGVTQKLAGGWSTYAIAYWGSGLWFSPQFTTLDASNTNTLGGLPDRVGDPTHIPGGRNFEHWFNPAAFATPQTGSFGNALPFSLESQPLSVEHLSLIKDVAITEPVHFTLTTMFSNLFNHPYLGPPTGNIDSSSGNVLSLPVGVFSSLERAAPRQITFQGAITF